jgi:hypothetical protein
MVVFHVAAGACRLPEVFAAVVAVFRRQTLVEVVFHRQALVGVVFRHLCYHQKPSGNPSGSS